MAYDSQDLARAILKADPDITKELKRFGVDKINGSGFVLHHFENADSKILSKSQNPNYNPKELAKILNNENYEPKEVRDTMVK